MSRSPRRVSRLLRRAMITIIPRVDRRFITSFASPRPRRQRARCSSRRKTRSGSGRLRRERCERICRACAARKIPLDRRARAVQSSRLQATCDGYSRSAQYPPTRLPRPSDRVAELLRLFEDDIFPRILQTDSVRLSSASYSHGARWARGGGSKNTEMLRRAELTTTSRIMTEPAQPRISLYETSRIDDHERDGE